MWSVVTDWIRQYEEALPHADPRTQDWLLLNRTPVYVWILTALYVVVVFGGPRVMQNRKPFGLQWFLVVYNMGLVALSLYMFLETLLAAYDNEYGLFCSPYNEETRKNPKELRMAKVLWWYFFSKAIELLDTVLMILRKKNSQVTFLHWFHHASMLNIWWWTMMFIPGGLSWFGSTLNCLVHVVMYAYYGLSAVPSLRDKLWWKKYITRFQLIQFCVTLSHTLYSLYLRCDFPSWGQYLLAGYMVSMLVLFSNFYFHAYLRRRNAILQFEKKLAAKEAGVHIQNGTSHLTKENGHVSNGVVTNDLNGYTKPSINKKSV